MVLRGRRPCARTKISCAGTGRSAGWPQGAWSASGDGESQPMMYDLQKSDSCIVAQKPANKPEGAGAESVERRREAEGNTGESCTRRTQSRGSVSQRLERVRERAKLRKRERFNSLLHHVDIDL